MCDKLDKRSFLGKALFAVLCMQIAFLMIFNIFFMHLVIDHDVSSVMSLAREMGKQLTLFPEHYSYQTTLDLHGMSILTAVFYRISGNIRLAQGLANNVIILVFLYLLYCILRRIEMSGAMKNLVAILYFLPWTTGQMGYIRMMFIAGTFSIHRAIIPLLLMGIILDQEKGVQRKKYIVRFLYLIYVCIINGMSSGLYTLMCSILPIFAFEIVKCFVLDDYSWFKAKRFITELIAVMASGVGIIIVKILGFSTHEASMNMINSGRLTDNIAAVIVGYFDLMGASIEMKDVRLGSPQSLSMIVNLCITLFLFYSLFSRFGRMIKEKSYPVISGYALSLVIVNFFVCALLDTRYASDLFEYRYHIISFGLAFFVMCEAMDSVMGVMNKRQKSIFLLLECGLILSSLLMGDAKLFFYGRRYNIDEMKQINQYLEDNSINTAVVYVKTGEENKVGRTLRVYSEDVVYITATESIDNIGTTLWGGTCIGLDNSEQDGKVAVITKQEYYEDLPGYYKNVLRYEKTFEEYSVYISERSIFDFEGGLQDRSGRIMDFPYSPGYEVINGYIDNDGRLYSSGKAGELIRSDYNGVKGNWEYIVHGSAESGDGEVLLLVNDVAVTGGKLIAGKEDMFTGTISLNGNEKVTFVISCNDGGNVMVSGIEMIRVSN